MRLVNAATVGLIKHFESLHDGDLSKIGLQPKLCPAGVWTIGWGHAIVGSNGKQLKGESGKAEAYLLYSSMTEEEADKLLAKDLAERSPILEKLVKVKLTDNQFGALMSLMLNIGVGNFKSSTLLRRLNRGDYASAAGQFAVWRKADGKVLGGLVLRREAERKLFLS